MISVIAVSLGVMLSQKGVGFVALHPLEPDWTFDTRLTSSKVFSLDPVDPGFDWNELVVSWNVDWQEGVSLEIKAKVLEDKAESAYYSFGRWTLDNGGRRESVTKQSDDWGRVDTDTLVLKRPARKVVLQLILTKPTKDTGQNVRFIGLSFRNSLIEPPAEEPNRQAWGKVIEVPQRSQMSYPNGNVLCSPTSVSMMLWHWADILGRPELNKDVPEVATGVYDPNWPGTGNWPFNTAYAG